MSTSKLIHLARALESARSDLSHAERADLAVQIMLADGVQIDANGEALFTDAARVIEPALPPSQRRRPRAQEPAQSPESSELAADLAAARTPVERSAIRERYAREKLGYGPVANPGRQR